MSKNTQIIAEIGINHNGSIELCKELMKIAKEAGCNYVKIQKRNPDVCVPESQKNLPKETPWGPMTYLDYKKRLEFDENQLKELFDYSNELDISFFASVWDKDSCDVMKKFTTIGKIPSALITDLELCKYARSCFQTLIVSTGMSSEREIEECISVCSPDVIMHTNSTYPCPVEDLNLNYILWLKQKYPLAQIGYSGHEFGLVSTFAAVALGSTWIERHITKDRTMWGSDQSSSIEPLGLNKLVKGIRDIELATKFPPAPRIEFPAEEKKKLSLRKQ
jgi:N-acetylneuraminate synthase